MVVTIDIYVVFDIVGYGCMTCIGNNGCNC